MTSITERFGAVTNRIYPRVTYSAGEELAAAEPRGSLASLAGRKYCVVVSYRRNGEPVATPVWFGLGEDRLYFRSLDGVAKLKRIAREPSVLVAPCNARGKPTGPPFRGRARILPVAEEPEAERRIQANYSAGRRTYRRAIGNHPARYVEVVPEVD